mmetsp:Transcript_28740/g.54026  ORF Transcript_28740/g.54026 Transcript_28740/m.54026 type:complete len:311 (+) Transcript_28740:1365-2297(+)
MSRNTSSANLPVAANTSTKAPVVVAVVSYLLVCSSGLIVESLTATRPSRQLVFQQRDSYVSCSSLLRPYRNSELYGASGTDGTPSSNGAKWLDKGILLSSFTDGLKSNPQAQDWLFEALVENLWKEEQYTVQKALELSNMVSPCNGPDPAMWKQLEDIDQAVQELYTTEEKVDEQVAATLSSSSWRRSLELLRNRRKEEKGQPVELRLLYIPTALYALRKDSTNTPGKQRQRARADGKKRRNEIVQMLTQQLGVSVSAVTLDFDDGSVKQPEYTAISSDDGSKEEPKFPAVREENPEELARDHSLKLITW